MLAPIGMLPISLIHSSALRSHGEESAGPTEKTAKGQYCFHLCSSSAASLSLTLTHSHSLSLTLSLSLHALP
jgi:hypothetical protein